MNKKRTRSIKEYVMTILVSLFIVTIVSFTLELELLFRSEKNVNFTELNVENLAKFCTIEELEKQLAKNPDDIIVNVRLAFMYETIKKLDKAKDFYENALKLSHRSNFAIYSYAMFCARNDLFVFASTLAEELSGNDKKTNILKAKIYEQMADKMSSKGNYLASVKSYQIAYKYAKSVGDNSYLKQIKTKYSSEYIKLADYHMSKKEVDLAISDLKNSIEIKNNALANYKLGLIYNPNDLKQAEKHINEAFWLDNFIVNPYIYNQIAQKLLDETELLGEKGAYRYYDSRLSRFKNKLKEVYLYKGQVLVENSTIITKKSYLDKIKRYLTFSIKNNTDNDLKSLYIKAEIYINGNKFNVEKKVVTKTHPLDAYETIEPYSIQLPYNVRLDNISKNNDIFVRYFAKKQEKAPWILIKIDFVDI